MALSEGGEAYSWGQGSHGALGTGSTTDAYDPVWISEYLEDPLVQLSAGGFHSGLVSMSGALYLCGENQYGQLGLSPEE